MFLTWMKSDPKTKLERKRKTKLREARDAMNRLGDRGRHADLMGEVDAIEKQIAALES